MCQKKKRFHENIAGGHMGPPLQLKRTALITGSVPPHPSGLRPAPLPLLVFSHFPLTGGIGLPLKGKARAGEDTRPYANTETVPFSS